MCRVPLADIAIRPHVERALHRLLAADRDRFGPVIVAECAQELLLARQRCPPRTRPVVTLIHYARRRDLVAEIAANLGYISRIEKEAQCRVTLSACSVMPSRWLKRPARSVASAATARASFTCTSRNRRTKTLTKTRNRKAANRRRQISASTAGSQHFSFNAPESRRASSSARSPPGRFQKNPPRDLSSGARGATRGCAR